MTTERLSKDVEEFLIQTIEDERATVEACRENRDYNSYGCGYAEGILYLCNRLLKGVDEEL